MEHRTFEDLHAVAETHRINGAPMSRRERLERWAAALEQQPDRPVKLLRQVEYLSASVWPEARAEDSPLTVAFADPVLRHAGLAGDSLGHAERFFNLSHRQVHFLVCDCHFHGAVNAGRIATRVRMIARRPTLSERWDAVRRAAERWLGPVAARHSG